MDGSVADTRVYADVAFSTDHTESKVNIETIGHDPLAQNSNSVVDLTRRIQAVIAPAREIDYASSFIAEGTWYQGLDRLVALPSRIVWSCNNGCARALVMSTRPPRHERRQRDTA